MIGGDSPLQKCVGCPNRLDTDAVKSSVLFTTIELHSLLKFGHAFNISARPKLANRPFAYTESFSTRIICEPSILSSLCFLCLGLGEATQTAGLLTENRLFAQPFAWSAYAAKMTILLWLDLFSRRVGTRYHAGSLVIIHDAIRF